MSVKVIALLHCHADAEETFEQELKRLVEATLKEPGCMQYELYQYEGEDCRYVIIEEWQDKRALEMHWDTPHHKNFVRVSPVLLHEPAQVKIINRLG